MNTLNHLILIIETIDQRKLEELLNFLIENKVEHFSIYSELSSEIKNKISKKLSEKIKIQYFDFGKARENLLEVFKNILIEKNSFDNLMLETESLEKLLLGQLNTVKADLIVKVSEKEESLENNALLEANYAEIFFIKKTAKAFKFSDLERAFKDYENRQRNFGS